MAGRIQKEIARIKDLIGRARFKTGLIKLENVIKDLEQLDSEDDYINELYNQLIVIKARYHTFDKNETIGVQDDDTELNQITESILKLVDEVKDIAIELAPGVAPSQQGTSAPAPVQTVSSAPAKIDSGQKKKGCLLAFAGDEVDVNIQVKKGVLMWPLLIIGGLLLLGGGLYLMKSSEPGPGPDHVIKKPEDTDTGKGKGSVDATTESPPLAAYPEEKVRDFPESSDSYKLGKYLTTAGNKYPKRFNCENVKFRKNSANLTSASKKELNLLAELLTDADKTAITIYGFLGKEESSEAFGGNKEISGDDYRAKRVYQYLLKRGVAKNRIDFYGDGTNDKTQVVIELDMKSEE